MKQSERDRESDFTDAIAMLQRGDHVIDVFHARPVDSNFPESKIYDEWISGQMAQNCPHVPSVRAEQSQIQATWRCEHQVSPPSTNMHKWPRLYLPGLNQVEIEYIQERVVG
jgi:hypothetical protein